MKELSIPRIKLREKTHGFGLIKPNAIYSLCGRYRVWFSAKPTCKTCKKIKEQRGDGYSRYLKPLVMKVKGGKRINEKSHNPKS